jgi:hypothetical protein
LFDPDLINRAVRRIAEDRIREAEEKGLFDNLPGHGKPLPPLEEGPADQHLINWVRGWAQRERLAEYQRQQARQELGRRSKPGASPDAKPI